MSESTKPVVIDKAEFLISIGEPREIPPPEGIEICVAGRSNVGKSSLINFLLSRHRMAHVSRTPGRTRLLNFFNIEARMYPPGSQPGGERVAFTLVDLPGYGFAKMAKGERRRVGSLLDAYLGAGARCSGALLLVDGRHPVPAADREVFHGLGAQGCPVVVVATKCDAVAKAKRVNTRRQISKALDDVTVVLTSSRKSEGRELVWQAVWPWLATTEG